jgi:HTH-type transcriptional regulator/antitoxin MqsA
MTRFEGETFTIEHAGMESKVENLSGWRCAACGEVEFDAESARRYAAAGDALVLRDRERQSSEIRRIRRKLGLSQVAAARLTGGGHNAFSRYERGEAAPLPAVVNLFRLLDKHPELLKELG